MDLKLPPEAQAFLDAIAVGEDADPRDYTELVGSTRTNPHTYERYPDLPGHYGFPDWAGWRGSHAAGRYQDEPATWKGICERSGLGPLNFRNPDDQDRGNWWLACDDYHRRSGRDLLPDLQAGRFEDVVAGLVETWASLSAVTFPKRYEEALEYWKGQE